MQVYYFVYKVTDEQLEAAVATSKSVAEVLRKLGKKETGGSHSHYSRRIKEAGFDTSHFTGRGWNKGGVSSMRRGASDILVLREKGRRAKAEQLRRALIEVGVPYTCSKCGQEPFWISAPLTLDVDHINGNWLDDRVENLRFLCPNCHSQFSRNLLGN